MSPTVRSLGLLRAEGYQVAVVERWLPRIGVRQDLWNFGDLLACHPRDGLFLIIQTTSRGHVSDRLAKAKGKPELAQWLKAGGKFEVHGWHQADDRWQVVRVPVTLEDLADVLVIPRRKRREQRTLFD